MKKLLLLLVAVISFNMVSAQSTNSGYKGTIEAGYSFGVGKVTEREDKVNLSTSHGYVFNDKVFVGAGVGVYSLPNRSDYFFPLFVDARVNVLDYSDIMPFVGIKTGYSIYSGYFNKIMDGGFYIAPQLGVSFRSPYSDISFNVSAEFNVQHFKFMEEMYSVQGLALKLGLEF